MDTTGVIEIGSPLTSNVTFSGNWAAYLAGPPPIANLTIQFLGSTTAASPFTVDATGVGSGVPVDIIIPSGATLTNITVIGGPDADTITGDDGRDTLEGGDGDDTILGGSGSLGDVLSGGAGNDSIVGSTGSTGTTNTRIDGDAGDDTILGSNGQDVIFGGDDNDSINGRGAADRINGEGGDDTLIGGSQNDTINGGSGNDSIIDNNGFNQIDAGIGDDTIIVGGALNTRHTIVAGEGNDSIDANALSSQNGRINASGGAGNDTITGSNANDTIDGGDDNDTINGRNGNDTITGGLGDDSIVGGGGSDSVDGGDGADTITAGTGQTADTLIGGAGNDSIVGSTSSGTTSATIQGGTGDDTIEGSAGADTISGGDDDDTIDGNAGQDTIDGGAGNDTIAGGSDDDSLTGGAGNDQFNYSAGDGRDTITDFGDGSFGDGDTSNNDFLDLSAFYTKAKVDAYNTATGSNIANAQELLRLDASDGTLDGIFSGDDQQSIIGFSATDGLDIQGGLNLATASVNEISDAFNVVCFGAGTRIDTPNGPKAVETLVKGDLVWTYDRGMQPVRWIGSRSFSEEELRRHPNLRPFLIKKGALGEKMPSSDLLVSPQHRILMHNEVAERMFGEKEVLIAAKHLEALEGVASVNPEGGVDYYHILLDQHDVVLANGAFAETLLLGEQALGALDDPEDQSNWKFPTQLLTRGGSQPVSARDLPIGRKGRKLVARLRKNNKACVSAKLMHLREAKKTGFSHSVYAMAASQMHL